MACMDICPLASELSVVNSNNVCPEEGCGKVFKASSALNMHLTKHHRNSCLVKRDASITVRYFCPEEKCVYHVKATRHFTQMKYLKQHYLKVHSEKRYICDSCQKAFATQELLRYHLQVCGIKFICSCGNTYSSYEALLTHSKRKQHIFDEKFKLGNKRSKTETAGEVALKKDTYCFSVDMMQPIYILPKPFTDCVKGDVITVSNSTDVSHCSPTFAQDKSMQTDPVELKRRRVCPVKASDKNTKRRASAQTQTGGIVKSNLLKKTAETQTMGDYILKKAMADADILSHDVSSTLQPSSVVRRRKHNSGTQTAGRKNSKAFLKCPNSLSSLNKPMEHCLDLLDSQTLISSCLKKDVGLPDLWFVDKNSSGTQTCSKADNALLESESFHGNNTMHSDLNLDLFGQDGSLCTSNNLQSIFEDNSDSFDNVVNDTSNFDSSCSPETMNSLDNLSTESFPTCNVTQTDQNLNHLFPRHSCDDESHSSFTLRTTTETQTTDDLADLDALLYTNMWTQTSEETLFSGLDFADIQTQTAWPLYGDEGRESVLVSAETQTAISSSTFNACSSIIEGRSWSSKPSNIETQTSEEDLQDFMAELDEN